MIDDKKILAVVLCREGSKTIKHKNWKPLLGRPLFMWSVLAASNSKYIDTVAISSNDYEILKIYREFLLQEYSIVKSEYTNRLDDLYWVQRPNEFATDTSKNEEAVIHALEHMKEEYNLEHDIVIQLQPTSPIRTENLIDKSIEKCHRGGFDSAISGLKHTPFIWQIKDKKWEYTVDKNGCCNRKMRQDFKKEEFLFHDDGNFYLTNVDVLLETECRIGENPVFIETNKIQSIQIDELDDFVLIENIIKTKKMRSLI